VSSLTVIRECIVSFLWVSLQRRKEKENETN